MNQTLHAFQQKVWKYYREHKRDFLWRRTKNPYHVFVSEIMLQQTQVGRVSEKYPLFLKTFPTFSSLARASLGGVMREWQGLGYNRRALFLKRAAEIIEKKYAGKLPKTPDELVTLPGVGKATAASVAVFAFQHRAPFIETNIRRVFIHEFFPGKEKVADRDILPLVEKTMDRRSPREWFYALMDYGAFLGKTIPNPNRKSRHYMRQAKFEGSRRQLRGRVIALLATESALSATTVNMKLHAPRAETKIVLSALINEGIVQKKNGKFALAE